MENACPLCNREYTALNQHLRVSHLVKNIEERGKLVLLASRRLNIRLEACPVQSCDAQKGTRLDRHFKRSHTELSDGAKTQMLDNLKRRLILGTLGPLRASNPSVPMVSTLDLDEAAGLEEEKEVEEEEGEEGECQVTKLKAEVAKLKDEVAKLKNQTSAEDEGSTDIPSGTILCPPFPDHILTLNTLLEEYKELQEGPHPDAKLRNNVQSKLHSIRNVLGWMSKGQSGLAKLKFLNDQKRLKGWVGYLVDCGMARTTSLHYLKNVRQFLVYVKETPPKTSCLGQKDLVMGDRYLKSVIKGWNRHVVQHQMSVKGPKLEHLHTNSSLWKLQGYVAAYLASLYGHRLGLFINMTDLEVSEAVHGDKDDYLLKMTHHKTNEAFGTAKMLLNKEEYGWLLKLIALKTRVWSGRRLHLRGDVNFITLRTAVATFARDKHGEDSVQRKSMARLMCHDTAMADKHYTMDLSVEQARNGRLLFEQSQETTNSRTRPQTERRCRIMLSPLKRHSPCKKPQHQRPRRTEDKVGYIKSRLVSGQRVPGSDLTAYRSYCVAALLIRHKLPKEAVVEFQVHDWLQRTTGTDGTTIRLTSSKAAGHTFTLSQQEDELLECYFCHVRAEATKRLTSEQGRFFVDCGGNPLTNLYADLQRLRKKYLPQVPGAAVDETPSSSETPSTSTGPARYVFRRPANTACIPGKTVGQVFGGLSMSLCSSAPPRKRQCVGAGFTAHRPLYRKWRNVQLLERTSYILSQAMGRQEATQPTEEAVRRALTKEGWVTNTPSVQDVVRGWVAPRDPPTCSRRLIRSISEQSWRGLAVRDFGGEKGKGVVATCPMDKGDVVCDYHGTLISQAEGRLREDSIYRFFFQEFCIDALSRCDCHPEVDTYGRFLNHSRKRPNLKAKRFDLTFPDGPRPVLVFLAMHNIKVGEELLWDYGVTKTSFGGEGKDLAWLDM
ncbi:hypothetical protein JOQ06_022189 [Pogonophryne albipinna]|uniref:SET domain-containing protein n=1 Tax=Pogonophryne albipinna TaxID=1090488 RepID=A0AAD6ACA6_9TELE|nr:hypothetical protein JOQ06_022189 [Pogonophryne albipinna]